MPLPGGPSDKIGNRYEYLWTVMCMIRVMKGEADLIHIEPAGPAGKGIEFSVNISSEIEYHQAKSQLTGKGVWSLRDLDTRGVLPNFYQKLNDPFASCVFASSHAAHPLDELACRARDAGSWEEFDQHFLSSDEWSRHFDQLCSRWTFSSKEDSYQRLRRIHVRKQDEASLRQTAKYALETLVSDNPSNALSALLEFASNQIHQKLTSADIWEFLEDRGFYRQMWVQQQTVTDAISELNQTYLSGIQPVGIGKEIIPRDEVSQVLQTFDDNQAGNIVLVSGKAGVGKTSTISQILDRIKGRDWPMLALRVDRLKVSSTPAELGQSFGLPASPVSVLAVVAEGRDCLLVVDQLDAISLASGRNPEFFDCIGAMLHQAQSHPNMRVLSACRKFDVDNDHRLRELIRDGGIAKEIVVEQFDEATVRSLVANLGLEADNLSAKQIDLLSLPIHLRLLAEVTPQNGVDSLGFQTAKDLYDKFWGYKRMIIRERIDAIQMRSIVNLIIENMTERQALFVPVALLDEYEEAVSVMVSENILVKDRARVSFFHESFFDYVFARRFASDGFDLVSYIRQQGQSLFIRSQVRQVLLHRRDISTQDFTLTLKAILTSDDIRTHLKTIALSLLGSLNDPTEEEWGVVAPLLESELSNHVMGAIYSSAAWFDVLDHTGTIQQWLDSNTEQFVNRAVWFLSSVQRERSERIAALLSPFVGTSELWDKRLAGLFSRSNVAASRRFFDFTLYLVHAGILDHLLTPSTLSDYFWRAITNMAPQNPDWTCELISSYSERLLILAEQSGTASPFSSRFERHRTAGEVIGKAAKAAPLKFAELLFPFLMTILERNADKSHGPPWRDRVWGHGVALQDGLPNNFLAGMESALNLLSVNEPAEFQRYVSIFRDSEYQTIHYLLVRSYTATPLRYADDAVEYLLADPAIRFEINHVSISSVNPILQLVIAVTPHCASAALARLENAILNHYPLWERRGDARTLRGISQLRLLESVEVSRLSEKALRRLQELRRKLGGISLREPMGLTSGRVGPPISEQAARKMNDNSWLKAMAHYSSNSSTSDSTRSLVGGAPQLAHVLEAQTKEDPERFAKLVHSMPQDTNSFYFEAILRGLASSDIDMETVVAACLRCHQIPDRPLGRWITPALVHVSDSPLPDGALDMIAWYAINDPDPDPVQISTNIIYYQGDQEGSSYDPESVGRSSVRGSAAESVAKLIFKDERYLSFFKPYLTKMVNDPSDAIRACVVEVLLGVLRYDDDFAVELFLSLCNTDERLLALYHVEMFLKYATQTHYHQLEPVLSQMAESRFDNVASAGARWLCYASLTVEEVLPLASRCVSGSKSLRLGAANVYSANTKISAHRSVCEDMLVKLFSDSDMEVRRAAARCFYEFEGLELGDYEGLVKDYAGSPAFEAEYDPLFDALEKTTADMSDVVLMACERLLDLAGKDTGDIRTAVSGTSNSVAKLVVRVYSRTVGSSFRSRCLDIIDKMSLFGAYGLDAITGEFDR